MDPIRAAYRVHVAQPGMSQQISNLEVELNQSAYEEFASSLNVPEAVLSGSLMLRIGWYITL